MKSYQIHREDNMKYPERSYPKRKRLDGEVGGSYVCLLLRIQLDNAHISVNNPERDPKTSSIDSPQIISKKIGRAETWSGAKQTHGTIHRGKQWRGEGADST